MIFNGLLLKIHLINRKINKLAQLKSVTSRHHLPQKDGSAPLPHHVSEGAADQSHCGDNPTLHLPVNLCCFLTYELWVVTNRARLQILSSYLWLGTPSDTA